MNLKKIHYFSGAFISIFIGIHLLNHLVSLFGPEMHISVMKNLRLVYRNIFVESILFFLISVQIITGIILILDKRKSKLGKFEKLQIFSGLYLGIFFIIHLSAVVTGRAVLNLDTNFYFGVAGLNTFPYNIFFIPYYTFAVLSVFGHLASIHSVKMKHDIAGISPDKQSLLIILFGFILVIIILYGLTNKFSGVSIPAEYNVLIGK